MILVTGGSGFLGSHLLFQLTVLKQKVRAIKRKTTNLVTAKRIFSYYSEDWQKLFNTIEWVEADLLDIYSLYDVLEGVEDVYHCGAVVSFSPDEKENLIKTNIRGTENIVNASLKKNIRKFCFVSSIASLGRANNKGLTDENTFWVESKKNSLYGKSKYYAEKEVWRGIAEGLNAVIVNPSIILGPGDWEKGSAKLVSTAWNNLKFYTRGSNGFVDVKDVASVMIKLMESEISKERFVISSENVDYYDFFNLFAKYFEKKPPSIFVGPFLSGIGWRIERLRSFFNGKSPLITKETARTANKKYLYDNTKIKEMIGFSFISIDDSIKDTCHLFTKDLIKH